MCVTEFSLVFHADSMLHTLNKRDLAARAKLLKVVAQAPPAEDLKLKAVAEMALSDDEDTCLRPVFKRRRKAVSVPTVHLTSYGWAPLPQVPPPNPSLLAILWYKRVRERTCKREDCGIPPLMPLPFLRRPCFPPRPEKNWTAWRRTS